MRLICLRTRRERMKCDHRRGPHPGQRQRDEAQLESARLTLSRYRTLLEQDSIARQEVDTQAALVKQLEGTVMTDRAAGSGTERPA